MPFEVVFGGPSGATGAADALMDSFSGVSAPLAQELRSEIVGVMSKEWNVTKIEDAIKPVLRRAGVREADLDHRANLIARTESQALLSEFKVRQFRQRESERGKQFLYRDAGVNDSRRTKLSVWIQQTIGDGKPLDECLRIMDEGIQLAKHGAFLDGGAFGSTPGKPIQLPLGFRRRGFVAHFNERDSIVRVV